MPHHHGRFGTSSGKAQKGTPSHHGESHKTPVSKAAVKSAKIKQGKDQLTYHKVKKVPGYIPFSTILNATGQKTFEANRKFFREKVLKSKNRSGYVDSYDSFSKWMEGRISDRTDAYGNVFQRGDGPSQKQKQTTTTSSEAQAGGQTLLAQGPTDSELSQSNATNAAGTELTAKRIKKRGRKINIYTSSSGKTSDKLILGKKSLLGMV